MNILHLFLSSAKSSQAGNRKKTKQVCAVIDLYFFLFSSTINSQNLWPPSLLSAPPFKSTICLLSASLSCGSHAPWHSASVHFNVTFI